MLTPNIKLKNFKITKRNKKLVEIFKNLKNGFLKKKAKLLFSLSNNYKYSFN